MQAERQTEYWGWRTSGLALGVVFVLATLLVKPIGVSTQFVIADGVLWDLLSPGVVYTDESAKSGYGSTNEYLNKSGGSYARNVSNPLNYSLVFVLSMILGGLISRRTMRKKPEQKTLASPQVWRDTFGDGLGRRYVACTLGGILVLFGARLAGGCTSGHMMSGMMQTSLSGYLFAMGAFAVAVPVALFVFRKGR